MTPAQIKELRLKLGLTRGRAAFVFGVDSRTWRRWEAGERDISQPVEKLLTLCVNSPAIWQATQAMAEQGTPS
jgi:DNA-binding transcriptional regulator YiaG